MSIYPSSAELVEIQDQLQALHKKMHAYSEQFPKNQSDFIGIAVKLTDAVWKLDSMIETAQFVERTQVRK